MTVANPICYDTDLNKETGDVTQLQYVFLVRLDRHQLAYELDYDVERWCNLGELSYTAGCRDMVCRFLRNHFCSQADYKGVMAIATRYYGDSQG